MSHTHGYEPRHKPQSVGLYIEQKIIRTGKLEDLTTEELENRMKQIIDDYSPILENVPFEEIKETVKQAKEKTKEDSPQSDTESSNESSLSSSHKKKGKQNVH